MFYFFVYLCRLTHQTKKMKIHTLKSETVCHNSERFLIMVGVGHYNLGFQFQNWGIRFMLIWWHICIHF